MSNNWIDNGDGTGICCDADADNNLIRLKLKKPQAWKWELTTSRSSPNIALPRIMLFNHMGDLLVDANRQADDSVYKEEQRPPKPPKRKVRRLHKAATTILPRAPQEDEDTGLGSLDSMEKQSCKNQRRNSLIAEDQQSRQSSLRYKTLPDVTEVPSVFEKINGCKAWRNSAPEEMDFQSLQICEATDSDGSNQRDSIKSAIETFAKSSSQLEEDENIDTPWRRKMSHADKDIIQSTINDLDTSSDRLYISKASWKPFLSNGHINAPSPTYEPFERRASSFKEVRFNVNPPSDDEDQKPRVKRRYRRPNTNEPVPALSGSILERLSAMKCRFSSPEFDTIQTHQVPVAPRYFLRTSRAGTLVVAEENLKHRRLRRKPPKPSSSAENIQSPSSFKTNSSFKQGEFLSPGLGVPCAQSQSMNNFADLNGNRSRRKGTPIRRNRSDGNIILVTSSEDEKDRNRSMNKGFARHRRNRSWQLSREDASDQDKFCV